MDDRGLCPSFHGPIGMSAPGRLRNRSASGHEAAKASRTRLAVSKVGASARAAAAGAWARAGTEELPQAPLGIRLNLAWIPAVSMAPQSARGSADK